MWGQKTNPRAATLNGGHLPNYRAHPSHRHEQHLDRRQHVRRCKPGRDYRHVGNFIGFPLSVIGYVRQHPNARPDWRHDAEYWSVHHSQRKRRGDVR